MADAGQFEEGDYGEGYDQYGGYYGEDGQYYDQNGEVAYDPNQQGAYEDSEAADSFYQEEGQYPEEEGGYEEGGLEASAMTNSELDIEQNTSGLHYAAGSGDANELLPFLQPGTVEQFDLNAPDGYGRTPLVYTVLSDAIDCCQLLLQAGAVVEATDADGRTAVHWSAFQGNSKMMKLFLESGGDVLAQDGEGRTPLHLSTGADSSKCTKQIVKRLPADGSVDIVDSDQMTAAHWCAFHGHHKHLEILISAGASLTVPDGEGKLPLHWTSANTNTKTLAKLLLAVPDALNVKDNEGRTVLHLAVADGSAAVVQALLETPGIAISDPDQMQRTPLHWAAVLGNAELATTLLAYGADPIAADDNGASALHYTTQNETTVCMQALLANETVVDFPDVDGRTAVMWAAGAGSAEAVGMMMERGFDTLAVDNSGGTALHAAAYAGSNDIVSVLLGAGSPIDTLDSMQHTPLVRACEMGHAAVVTTLIQGGSVADITDVDGRSPLHWASLGGFDYICRALIETGVNVDVTDGQGRTALQCAAYGGFIDVMTVLCENKADVNTVDEEGISALHWASSTGQLEAVKLLTKHGAVPNQMEADGEQLTPLDYAKIGDGEGNANTAIVDFLTEHGGMTATTIKDLSATKLQNAWRNYQGRKTLARKKMGIGEKGTRGKRQSYATSQQQKIVGGAKSDIQKDSAANKKAKADKITTSAVQREAMKRKKRIKEREAREKSQAEQAALRRKDDDKRRAASSSILLKSAKLHSTTIKERSRMAIFREKQRAATTIQVFWRQWKYKGFVPATNKKPKKKRTKILPGDGKSDAYVAPLKFSSTKIGKDLEDTVKSIDEGMKGLQLRKRELAIVDTFKQTSEWREAVAALTIQLFWRQYKRRKLVKAAARRKNAYLDEWRVKQNIKTEFTDKVTSQRTKFTAVYKNQTLSHPYHAAGPAPMYRPSYVTRTPSAAVTSFNFAVGSYVNKHTTTRRGSADYSNRSPSRRTVRSRSRGVSQSPKKKPVFAF